MADRERHRARSPAPAMVGGDKLRIVPANEVSWDDLRAVVGAARCFDSLCFCQRFKILKGWHSVGEQERAHRLRTQADC